MLNSIEKVIYINLAHRTDRREQIETELRKVFPSDKILRFDAIKHEKGGIGCSMSHIGALKLAIQNNWKNVLIVEDDMEWQDFEKGCEILERIRKTPHDVIMLSGHEVIYNTNTYKLTSCCARTAYIVNRHYYTTLLNNFETGLSKLLRNYTGIFRGDIFWQTLQRRDKWYIVVPQMCIQRPSFSDIEKTHVNYSENLKLINVKRMSILDRILKRK